MVFSCQSSNIKGIYNEVKSRLEPHLRKEVELVEGQTVWGQWRAYVPRELLLVRSTQRLCRRPNSTSSIINFTPPQLSQHKPAGSVSSGGLARIFDMESISRMSSFIGSGKHSSRLPSVLLHN